MNIDRRNLLSNLSLPANNFPVHELELDVTNRCNLCCDYCFRKDKGNIDIDLDVAKHALDWFFKASQHIKQIRVTLFGGEPLINFDVIRELVPYGKRKARQLYKSIHFSATTNSLLINSEIMDFWKNYGMGFHLSIDGCPESHDKHRAFPNGRGTSRIVAENARMVLAYRPDVMARWTIMPDTACYMLQSAQYLYQLGFINMGFEPAAGIFWDESELTDLEQGYQAVGDFFLSKLTEKIALHIHPLTTAIERIMKPQKRMFHCGAGRGMIHMDVEGNFYPCHRWKEAKTRDKVCLGNLFEKSFRNDLRQRFICFSMNSEILADCPNCEALSICTSICLAACAESHDGDFSQPDPIHCHKLKILFQTSKTVIEKAITQGKIDLLRNALFKNKKSK